MFLMTHKLHSLIFLFENKWAPAKIIELSEEIRLKMTERKRLEWE